MKGNTRDGSVEILSTSTAKDDAMDDKAMEKWFQKNLKEVASNIRFSEVSFLYSFIYSLQSND